MFGASTSAPNFCLVDNTITDTVSSLKWSPAANHLAASSWDGKVRVWDIKDAYGGKITAQPMLVTDMTEPILQVSWNTQGNIIFAGSSDNTIKAWDLQQNRVVNIGQRTMPVAQVHWCKNMNVLYAMSWDKTITIWDGKQPNPIMTATLINKVFFLINI